MDTTVCLTVDFDAVSPWLHAGDRDSPVNRSRGRFGAEVGAPRLLELFDDRDVPTTWFVPGHTVESFPEVCERVVADGHPVQHHGWSHRPPGEYEGRAAERADLERGVGAIESLTGRAPRGYRSPSWDLSEHTADLLVELGFEYDSSGMAREFRPYELHRDDPDPDEPYDRGEPTGVVEVPVSWQRDDYPPLAFTGDRGFADEAAVYRSWRRQFDYAHERVEDAVYVLTLHPQVSGKGHRVERLERLLDHVADADGAAFDTVNAVVERYDG